MSERAKALWVSVPAEERGMFEQMVREELRGTMELIGEIQEGLGGRHTDDAEALRRVEMCRRILSDHFIEERPLRSYSAPRRARTERVATRGPAVERRKRRMREARAVRELASILEPHGYALAWPSPGDGEVCRFRASSGQEYIVARTRVAPFSGSQVEPTARAILRAAARSRRTAGPFGIRIDVPHDVPQGPSEPMK